MSDVNVQTLRRHHAVQRFPGILRKRELVSVFVNLETIKITRPEREKRPRVLDVSAAIASQTSVTIRQRTGSFCNVWVCSFGIGGIV